MKRLLYLFLAAVFAFGVCVPVFACEGGEKDKEDEWRKYINDDKKDDPSLHDDAEWKKALLEDDDDPSSKPDAEWRKALLEDKNDPSESADAEWRKAMKEDKGEKDPSEAADAEWRKAMLEDK